ncbi:hypothetical protein BKH44_06190 [Helicobacter sp. 13S00477-4]|nr:hypothetical protein BKH44_06190 [Helicobacter sp. 13S00477-4]
MKFYLCCCNHFCPKIKKFTNTPKIFLNLKTNIQIAPFEFYKLLKPFKTLLKAIFGFKSH